ncbi:MAG: ribonuclease III [Candidatus Levybacteria bacterium]|nr:ribonuclease III [Candidatus Levybacteria bacterium]
MKQKKKWNQMNGWSSFVVSDFLYKKYPHFPEGTLTNLRSRLVNTKTLAQVAKELDFGSLLRLSKGEEESKGRQNQSLLADSFEAFIGALFLDQGIQKVSAFLATILLIKADEFVEKKSFKDAKSLLQEYVQAKKQNSPLYKVLSEEGPPHAKVFTVGVYVQNKLIAKGKGNSKQEAEKQSAELALETLFKK